MMVGSIFLTSAVVFILSIIMVNIIAGTKGLGEQYMRTRNMGTYSWWELTWSASILISMIVCVLSGIWWIWV